MNKRSTPTFRRVITSLTFALVQFAITCIAILILLFLSVTVIAFQWDQIHQTTVPSIFANQPPATQLLLSEAQQDITVSNTIIAWSGFFLAFTASFVALAGFFGIREFQHNQRLRRELDKESHEVTTLKTQVTDVLDKLLTFDSQTFLEIAYNMGAAKDAYRLGNNKRAIACYLSVLKLQPQNKLVMERLGRAYSNLEDTQSAINYLQQALSIDPEYVPALRSLALCYRYSNKDKAIETFNSALKLKSDDYEALDFLGLIYRDNGLIDEAIDAHEKALVIKRRPETQFFLSLLHAKKGNNTEALRMALNAVASLRTKDPNEEMRPVWQATIRAGLNILEGKEDEAYTRIESLIEYITTQRICDALTGHFKFLLEATGHDAWKPKFLSAIKVK